MRRVRAAALAAALLLVPACTGSDDDTLAVAGSDCPQATLGVESKDTSTKPVLKDSCGPAPEELQVTDIVVGEGDEAAVGDTVSMQYVGVLYEDGTEFDASWDRGEPFDFQLGRGLVIAGWDEGIAGMREGGRRQLVIPPEMGYGDQGAGDAIPGGATLVFVVDLAEIVGP
jgi:peptidylprolyl isomerase